MTRVFWFALPVTLAFLAGWYGHSFRSGNGSTKVVREDSIKYNFTNPLVLINNDGINFSSLDPLKSKIEEIRDEAIKSGLAKSVSVYFRDPIAAEWTGVDEDRVYDPASLQKVILLLAYMRGAEQDPALISKKLLYEGKSDDNEYYKTSHSLVKGRYYSVNDLLIDMITKSGNDSTEALFKNISANEIAGVYEDLDLPFPKNNGNEELSPRLYAKLFRVLYNSTYLNRYSSEQVLSLLYQTEFKYGLKAGVPTGIVVSNKFGERTNSITGERQLHDCGIVYHPNHPYLLCIMTKGGDFKNLEKIIADISKVTYNYWESINQSALLDSNQGPPRYKLGALTS